MSGTAPDTAGTNGAAVPAEEESRPELDPKAKRKLRERVRREVESEFMDAERARLRAEKGKPAGGAAAPAEGAASAAPVEPDAVLLGWAAVFLRGVLYPLLSFAARIPPWRGRLDLDRYTEARAKDEAAAWVPMLRAYTTLRAVVKWTTVPARVLATVRELFVRDGEAKPS